MRRATFAAAAVVAALTAGCGPATQGRAFPTPPGWHPHPTAPAARPATFCINGTECFRVDGNGYPYGPPSYGGNASPGVRGLT